MRSIRVKHSIVKHALLCAIASRLLGGAAMAENLLRNPGFESVPGSTTGQGLMPNDWVVVLTTPDTYSNDGSYGLLPSFLGNFSGVSAFEGLRWVAGWSVADERFGQTLTTPLVAGVSYRLTGRLHQSVRSDLNHEGGYQLQLALPGQTSGTTLTTIGPTTGTGNWEPFDVSFEAPTDASSRPLLIFDPVSNTPGSGVYPGLDDLVLEPVSSALPALRTPLLAMLLLAMLLLGMRGASRARIRG